MDKSFADRIEDNSRLDFKIFEAELTIEEQISKIEKSNAPEELKAELIEMVKRLAPDLIRSVAFKEIFK